MLAAPCVTRHPFYVHYVCLSFLAYRLANGMPELKSLLALTPSFPPSSRPGRFVLISVRQRQCVNGTGCNSLRRTRQARGKGGSGERGAEQQFQLLNLIGQAVGKERATDVVDAKKDVWIQAH